MLEKFYNEHVCEKILVLVVLGSKRYTFITVVLQTDTDRQVTSDFPALVLQ